MKPRVPWQFRALGWALFIGLMFGLACAGAVAPLALLSALGVMSPR